MEEVNKMSSEEVIVKKILKIKNGEYLLEVRGNAVATTYNKDYAMDISNWSLEQLGYIVGNLKKVGYTSAEVMTISKNSDKDNDNNDEK